MTINYVLPEFQEYARVPKIPDLDTVIWKWTREQVQEWWDAAKKVEQANRDRFRHNQETRALWRKIFEARGGKPWGARGTTSLKWFDTAIDALGYPSHSPTSATEVYAYYTFTLCGEKVSPYHAVMFSPHTLMDVWDGARKRQEAWDNRQATKNNEVAILLSLASKLGVDPAGFESTDGFLHAIRAAAEEVWVNEHYPDETEMEVSCDNCDTWRVGEHRCSCGNRRVHLVVEGNVVTGFYAYARAD